MLRCERVYFLGTLNGILNGIDFSVHMILATAAIVRTTDGERPTFTQTRDAPRETVVKNQFQFDRDLQSYNQNLQAQTKKRPLTHGRGYGGTKKLLEA